MKSNLRIKNPKDSNVYSNDKWVLHTTPSGSNEPVNVDFYKHLIPSGFIGEYKMKSNLRIKNPKDSNVYSNDEMAEDTTPSGSNEPINANFYKYLIPSGL